MISTRTLFSPTPSSLQLTPFHHINIINFTLSSTDTIPTIPINMTGSNPTSNSNNNDQIAAAAPHEGNANEAARVRLPNNLLFTSLIFMFCYVSFLFVFYIDLADFTHLLLYPFRSKRSNNEIVEFIRS